MRRSLLLCIVLLSYTASKLSAQSCFNVNAGNDTTISCLQTCLDLHARIPDLRTSETYRVVPIAYNPYAYVTPFGTTDPLVNADDHFSDSFALPFPFCFYGNTYTKTCVGSNGVITFDVRTNAKTDEGYIINPGDTIWYAGGVPNNISSYYAPRASIFLAYVDLNPLTSPIGNKIEWRVEGSAPCRRFVVSYYHQGNYDNLNCTELTTMQAVLYEGSGIIDVYYESKPACPVYQGGLAIAGVQNWNQDQAVTPPGWNGTVWTADSRGIRYVPSGPNSLLSRVELYKNNTLISTGTATPLGNGEMDALFSNICQSEDSMSYVVKAFYKQCDNPAIETEGSDTMIVYKTLNPVTLNVTDVKCWGGTGTITVTSPLAPNIEYSIDGGTTWQSSPVFSVLANTYTIKARIVGSQCYGSATTIVSQPSTTLIAFPATSTDATCAGNDGTISLTAGGGTPPYEYSINGIDWQSNNFFTGLTPGLYQVLVVRDANGCTKSPTGVTINVNDAMFLDLGPDSSICVGQSITLQPQTNPGTDTFKWVPAATLDHDTAKNPIATPNDTTKYILTAKWGLCTRKDSVTINVLHKPVVFAGKDTTICNKTAAALHGLVTNTSGSVNYSWSPPDSLATPNAINTIARPDTSQQFRLTVTDNYGCNFSVSDSMMVFIDPPIVPFAGNDTNAVKGVPHQLFSSGGTSYLWSPAGPLNNPFAQNPLATLYTDTYFRVQVTDAVGCSATDDVFIKVYDGPAFYLPNSFSPNGDGLNDIFRPIPVGIASTDYFMVFDRYGEPVFQTREWMKGWDGKFKGKDAAMGVYSWILKGKDKYGKVVEMKGTVMLLR